MSTTFNSYTIIGIRLERKNLIKKVKLDYCWECEYKKFKDDIDTYEFCPKCGSKIKRYNEEFIDIIKEGGGNFYEYASYNILDMPLFEAEYEPVKNHDDICSAYIGGFSGMNLSDSRNSQQIAMIKITDQIIAEEKEKIKKILEPHGLWNEENFGIWSFIYID